MMSLLALPTTYEQAILMGYGDAVKLELDAIRRFGAVEIVDIPVGRKLLTWKWVFANKMDQFNHLYPNEKHQGGAESTRARAASTSTLTLKKETPAATTTTGTSEKSQTSTSRGVGSL